MRQLRLSFYPLLTVERRTAHRGPYMFTLWDRLRNAAGHYRGARDLSRRDR